MGIGRRLKNIPGKVYLRYLMLNLPGGFVLGGVLFIARTRIELPGWFIVLLLVIWFVKDAILFAFVWQSYDWDRPGISRTMTGSTGVVKKPLAPEGLVQIYGELWKAQNVVPDDTLPRGTVVRVVKREGLILSVVRDNSCHTNRERSSRLQVKR